MYIFRVNTTQKYSGIACELTLYVCYNGLLEVEQLGKDSRWRKLPQREGYCANRCVLLWLKL